MTDRTGCDLHAQGGERGSFAALLDAAHELGSFVSIYAHAMDTFPGGSEGAPTVAACGPCAAMVMVLRRLLMRSMGEVDADLAAAEGVAEWGARHHPERAGGR